jgi:cytochrome c biogenesis protein ResB
MPSYPLFEYKQDNRWQPPGADEIKFWLRLQTGMNEDAAWRLDLRDSSAVLVVTTPDARHEVNMGKSVRLDGGVLRFDELSMWMGYRVFYDPTIHWMFFISIAGVLGLAQYFWRKLNLQPWVDENESEPANTAITRESVNDNKRLA